MSSCSPLYRRSSTAKIRPACPGVTGQGYELQVDSCLMSKMIVDRVLGHVMQSQNGTATAVFIAFMTCWTVTQWCEGGGSCIAGW